MILPLVIAFAVDLKASSRKARRKSQHYINIFESLTKCYNLRGPMRNGETISTIDCSDFCVASYIV